MTRGTLPFVYFQKKIISAEKAKVPIASNSLQYGTTCFGGIRGYCTPKGIYLFRPKDHHKRLMQGAKILALPFHMDYPDFLAILTELIKKNAPTTDFYIRPFIFSQTEQLGPRPKGLIFDLAIYFVGMKENYLSKSQGLSLMVSSYRKFSDASLPTKAKAGGCYVNSFLAASEATRLGFDDALMSDERGWIVEGTVANLLGVYQGTLVSPPTGEALLDGITLRSIKALLEDDKIEIRRERIDRSMLYSMDELMLLGTAVQIAPVHTIDGRLVGDKNKTPFYNMIKQKFQSVLDKKHPKAKEWLVPIPL